MANQQLVVRSAITTLSQNIIDLKHAVGSTRFLVWVGGKEDAYSTISSAVDAGEYNLLLSASITQTTDVVVPEGIHLQICIPAGLSMDMLDCVFTSSGDTPSKITFFSRPSLTESAELGGRGTIRIIVTEMPASEVFGVDALSMSNMLLFLDSPTVQDVSYTVPTTQLMMDDVHITMRCQGATVPCLAAGQHSVISSVKTLDASDLGTNAWMWACDSSSESLVTFRSCSFISDKPYRRESWVRLGVADTDGLGKVKMSDCFFYGISIGSLLNGSVWSNCTFGLGLYSDTIGGTVWSTDYAKFTNCTFELFQTGDDFTISGKHNTFRSCTFKLADVMEKAGQNIQFTSTSDSNVLSGCDMWMGTSGWLLDAGRVNKIMYCVRGDGVGRFAVQTAVTADGCTLIGNTLSAPLSDGGTFTQNIGNFMN